MKEYVTCADCLKKGKPPNEPNLYANDNIVTSIQCPHCNKFLNTKTLT